jgi:HD-GYP domain-containing protein (c-di-GMP phosphodiesterase class II)
MVQAMSLIEAAKATMARKQEPAVGPGVLEGIAAHCRLACTCLFMLSPEGKILYADGQAGPFHEGYVIPALRLDKWSDELCLRARQLNIQSPAQIWDFVPGVALCVIPHVERRQMHGVLMLAAKREDFEVNQQVNEVCRAVGAEPGALAEQAGQLTGHGSERLLTKIRLLLSMLADRLRLCVLEEELNSLSTQLANTYEELTLIDQLSSGMRVNRRSADFFQQACLDVMQVIGVKGMGVALFSDKCRQEPALYGETSVSGSQVRRLADQLLTTLGERKSCLLINDLKSDKGYQWLAESARQLIAVPLQRGDEVLGCLFGLDKANGDFDSVDAKLLTSIANESAIYLENAMLFGDLHDLMMGLLHSLTSAVDAKDAYTCGHSERVALLSRHLATKLSIPDTEVEHVYMAGLLHDVGKIGIPESVLQKTGRLTVEEFEQIKKHPLIGARILDDVKQLEDIIPGVLHHHERYDGNGYPAGLRGRDIPLMGRVICLADCFDAMTSNRTYRKALPLEVALAEIRRCSGTQFDPSLADMFLSITPDQFRLLLRDHEQQAKKLLELQQTLRAA